MVEDNSSSGPASGLYGTAAMLPRIPVLREDSASDVLAAMSISMSVAMAKVFSKTGKSGHVPYSLVNKNLSVPMAVPYLPYRSAPRMCIPIAENLAEVIGSLKLSGQLQRSFGGGGPVDGAVCRALASIRELAQDMVSHRTITEGSEVGNAGLGLLLSTALLSGSVQAVLDSALLLLLSEEGAGLVLPQPSLDALARLFDRLPQYGFSLQDKTVTHGSALVPFVALEVTCRLLSVCTLPVPGYRHSCP